jgi:GntR family transcriptional regulator, transcriptional repressor for pyruvate dehydrogenase complex
MDKERLHNKIVREILARVAGGQYREGRRLPSERSLCGEFEVARGTLRKALATLEELGVVSIKANSGVYVRGLAGARLPQSVLPPDFDHVDLCDIIDARKAIETAAFQQAARRITGPQLRKIGELVERMSEAVDDLAAFLELDLAFHQGIVRASGNAVLGTAFDAIYQYHRFSAVYTSQREGDEREALNCHRRLLKALEKRDSKTGCRILAEHLDAMARYDRRARRSELRMSVARS